MPPRDEHERPAQPSMECAGCYAFIGPGKRKVALTEIGGRAPDRSAPPEEQ